MSPGRLSNKAEETSPRSCDARVMRTELELDTMGRWWNFREFGKDRKVGFDVGFGVFLPVICLVLDPFVFRNWGPRDTALLGRFARPAYFLMGPAMLLLLVAVRERTRGRPAAMLSGALWTCAFFASGVGCILLPFAAIATATVIGWLGYTPLFTMVVFARNATRLQRTQAGSQRRPGSVREVAVGPRSSWEVRQASFADDAVSKKSTARRRTAADGTHQRRQPLSQRYSQPIEARRVFRQGLSMLLGALSILVPPAGAYFAGEAVMERSLAILRDEPENQAEATSLLRRYRYVVYTEDLVGRWAHVADTPEGERIRATYQELTGQSIEPRRLSD